MTDWNKVAQRLRDSLYRDHKQADHAAFSAAIDLCQRMARGELVEAPKQCECPPQGRCWSDCPGLKPSDPTDDQLFDAEDDGVSLGHIHHAIANKPSDPTEAERDIDESMRRSMLGTPAQQAADDELEHCYQVSLEYTGGKGNRGSLLTGLLLRERAAARRPLEARIRELEQAAATLRAAQREYVENRLGPVALRESLGAVVARAAADLDEVLAK